MQLDMQDTTQGDNIPPELQDILDEMKAVKNMKIELIGKEVAKRRDEAVSGRKQSGIEVIWEEDEEYYEGVDDANRDSHPWLKSASTSGGISRSPTKSNTRCSSFFNITRQFVESASSRMGDILLPAGDWNFAAKATPVQDNQNPTIPAVAPPAMAQPPAPVGGQSAQGQPQPAPPAPSIPTIDPVQLLANQKAQNAELKIQDWLVECSYHTECRKVIEDSAKLGTGVFKGPFPENFTSQKTVSSANGVTVELVSSTNPASRRVDVWDFFPDPDCGDDIHNGNYVLERDRLTAKQLKKLKRVKGYLSDQIDKVLEEGPNKCKLSDDYRQDRNKSFESEKYEVWYFYGDIDVASLSAMNVTVSEQDHGKDTLPAVVTLVNDTPIKAFINPLDTGEFPYDLMPWQRMAGSPWGIGISRQGRTAQDMLNAAARAMMDNAGLSSGPMIIMRQNAIRPADGVWEVTARKVWLATEQADIRSVSDAIMAINIPMMQRELDAIIQLAYKMMEDATGVTFLLQGQQGSAPDTVGGMELLHRNASAILRRLARVFDERVTEPHIRRYYTYLLADPKVPDSCKGDMKIEAIGSSALVEREIQAMQSMQLLQFSLNPAYGLDPEKAMIEVLKAQRFIPDKWTMDAAKKQGIQPAIIPAIEVQKMKSADFDKQIQLDQWQAKLETTEHMHADNVKTDRETIYAKAMSDQTQTNAQMRIQELALKKDLAMLEYATKQNISLDMIKADLAKESMRLRTQKELAGAEHAARAAEVATPSVEPPGRAKAGEAFQA